MELRKSIVEVIEMLMADSSRKFTEKEQDLKVKKWHLALADVSDKHIEYGMIKASQMPNGFMLDSGSFRDLCLTKKGDKGVEDLAHESWALVMSNLNSYISPVFKDGAISEAIRKMGGWKSLCLMLESDIPFRKKDFMGLYESSKRSGKAYPSLLTGRANDVRYIGFKGQDDINSAKQQIENKQNSDKQIIGLIDGK